MNGFVTFLYEVGELKRQDRSGWKRIGIKNPESVLEHSARTALIAYFLARKEGTESPEALLRIVLGGLLHDLSEARIGDLDHLAQQYLDTEQAEHTVVEHQMRPVLGDGESLLPDILFGLLDPSDQQGRAVRDIVKDADKLECSFQAREYAQTYRGTDPWIALEDNLETSAGVECLRALKATQPTAWNPELL